MSLPNLLIISNFLPLRKSRLTSAAWLRNCNTSVGIPKSRGSSVLTKILIVDDSPAEVRLMQSVLDGAGYMSISVHDPMRLEQTIDIERPNLILMDVVMPQRNGFQACRELKGNADYARIPVVMVSSKNTESDKFWAKQQGADGYVVKPFTSEELLGTVRGLVGKS
ncbi:MAG: PleD family two-component system response regulator [Terriglobales bacterium]